MTELRTILPKRMRNRHLLLLDLAALVLSPVISFLVRFEHFDWIGQNPRMVVAYILLAGPIRLLVFYSFGMYRRLWRHASIGELKQILTAGAVAGMFAAVVGFWIMPGTQITGVRVPFSVVFIDAFLITAAIALPRLLARTVRLSNRRRRRTDPGRPALIVGAGDTAKLVAKELIANPRLGFEPIGFVDDDLTKQNHMLLELPIMGTLSAIKSLVKQHGISELIIAMPSAPGDVVRKVVRAGLDCGIPTLTVPSLPELISAKTNGTSLREVEIQDLLRREPIETDLAAVAELATGEAVLVTGAGGSIGSELCRQIARLAPSRVVLLGHGENSIFDVLHELKGDFPDVEFIPIIADVRDRKRIAAIFRIHKPHAVFHAAAHKHVPLMEENVIEAITNNIFGTLNVVDASLETGCKHFVFISTDKAVRPTSVMGATKRVAELIVQHAAVKYDRNFVSVRFGNVLGSRGSVVPTFLRQIRAGGPVTVTHPEMQRYFMTIPEAVQLVLQAGALGRGGEVFLLDMGEPIRIVDIATDLIRLSGLTVGADIQIKFTGMRLGEKLYEEMFFSAENVLTTDHPKVLRARNGILPEGVMRRIEGLVGAAEAEHPDEELRNLLRSLVPDFHPHPAAAAQSTDGDLRERVIRTGDTKEIGLRA
ncbi:MAG TPA: nucleoside-diphosphate sugar epimerase/dehydratase [Gemmatimonadaceae bacterium]|nr:nucleoside-diphosphate sugar epimerase/dehydratase [Gemmatimonadaceae bacterium]